MRRFENINGEKPVIEIKEHAIPGSKHIILTFKNGYGASIIPEYHYPTVKHKNPMDAVKNRKVIPVCMKLQYFSMVSCVMTHP